MIFGIKTRKDKKIDELQKEIERLKYLQSYKVFQKPYDVKKLSAVFYVPFEQVEYIPDGYVKNALVHQLASNLKRLYQYQRILIMIIVEMYIVLL